MAPTGCQAPPAGVVLSSPEPPRSAAERGAADARAFLERPATLDGTQLADFGRGGPGEAAVRRVLHALRVPPGLLRAGCRVFGERRARRVGEVAERYAYWHGARSRLGDEAWRQLTRGTAILMYHAFAARDEPASRFVVPSRPARPSHPPAMITSMARQLALHLETSDDDWRLDEHTREAGRRGVAEARRILAEVMKRSAA